MSIRLPAARAQLVEVLGEFADPDFQRRQWVGRAIFPEIEDSFLDAVNGLLEVVETYWVEDLIRSSQTCKKGDSGGPAYHHLRGQVVADGLVAGVSLNRHRPGCLVERVGHLHEALQPVVSEFSIAYQKGASVQPAQRQERSGPCSGWLQLYIPGRGCVQLVEW